MTASGGGCVYLRSSEAESPGQAQTQSLEEQHGRWVSGSRRPGEQSWIQGVLNGSGSNLLYPHGGGPSHLHQVWGRGGDGAEPTDTHENNKQWSGGQGETCLEEFNSPFTKKIKSISLESAEKSTYRVGRKCENHIKKIFPFSY